MQGCFVTRAPFWLEIIIWNKTNFCLVSNGHRLTRTLHGSYCWTFHWKVSKSMHCEKEWKEVRRCCGSRRSVGLDWYQRRAFRNGSWKQEEEGRKWAVTGQNRVAIDIGGIHRFIHCIVFGIPGIRHRRINHPMEVAISIPGLISIISPNHDLTDCK